MSDYLLDTNILILYFRKTEGYRDLLDTLAKDDTLYISAMSRLEIVRGMRDRERKDTFNLLDSLETIDIAIEIADQAGELIRSWRTRGMILGDACLKSRTCARYYQCQAFSHARSGCISS